MPRSQMNGVYAGAANPIALVDHAEAGKQTEHKPACEVDQRTNNEDKQ